MNASSNDKMKRRANEFAHGCFGIDEQHTFRKESEILRRLRRRLPGLPEA
jgi:hypothetical protein